MQSAPLPVRLRTIAAEWARIGCTGFGGPPAHISLLRQLCVKRKEWLSAGEFEDAIAATNLLPGPASTQLAIYCAWRLRGWRGALLGGTCFILPGLIVILALSALFLESRPPHWVEGAAAGTGSAVAAVALNAALGLALPSWARAGPGTTARLRWAIYALAGAVAAAAIGPYLVLVLLCAGLAELAWRAFDAPHGASPGATALAWLAAVAAPTGGIGALAWVALKVGGLSYGGGFVIVPLMQTDAVHHYHWMTSAQFLNAVALGQVTPGPVVQTVAVVGYAAAKLGGGLLAALIAFAPSFCFVLFGGRHFGRIRASSTAQGFLAGAGPAAIGAIAGAAVPLGLALAHVWQLGVLAGALVWLVARRGNVVLGLVGAGLIGVAESFLGLPVG
jgi:chromate transporter